MSETLKDMFDKHINKQTIYYQITNNQKNTKHFPIKFAILSICTILIFVSGFLYNQSLNPKSTDSFAVYAYNEEGVKQNLKIDTQIMLSQYNKLQSQVPGYPIKITLNKNNIYDMIEIKVKKGSILTWNQKNGVVKDHGSIYRLQQTETIYLDIGSTTTAQLIAKKGAKMILFQELQFTSDSEYHIKAKNNTTNIFIE